jgi:hypothetical protein
LLRQLGTSAESAFDSDSDSFGDLRPPPFAALSVMSLALLSRDKRAMVRFMGHNKGRNNARKRAKRRKKTERLALVKKKQQATK